MTADLQIICGAGSCVIDVLVRKHACPEPLAGPPMFAMPTDGSWTKHSSK